MRRVLVIGVAIILSACMSTRSNFVAGMKSFQVQDYRQAFVRLMPSAVAHNPDAEYAIGYMYYYGRGVNEDRKKAWFWISAAAAAGQADAVQAVQILNRPY